MKKFFRLLFSRVTVILLAILLQVVAAALVITVFQEYYMWVRIVSSVLTVIVLMCIINRDMTIEGKLPWAITVAMLPVLGIVLYLSFSRNYASKRERKLFAALPHAKFATNDLNVPLKVAGQIRYLNSMGNTAFTKTQTVYFKSGENFWQDLIVELEKAEKFIFLEYFIVERGKMFDRILEVLTRKVSEGVEVRLMYDDVGSLPHVGHLFCRRMRKLGIDCVRFGKLKPIVSAVYNNRDHRKITVIDGKVGYTGGINLADEYINETSPFGYWKDTAVKLVGDAVGALTFMFLQMFAMAQNKNENFEQYLIPSAMTIEGVPEQNPDVSLGVVVPFGDGPKPLYPDYVARSAYLNLINSAEKSLYVTTPYLVCDEAFNEAIIRAADRGVDVNIVIPGIPDKKSVYCLTKQSANKLAKHNVHLYVYTNGFVHAKGIVADDVCGIVGTINLDYRSFMHHYEDGVFMYGTQSIKSLREDMTAVIAQSAPLDFSHKLNLWEKIVCFAVNVFRPML